MIDGDWDTCVQMAKDQVKEGSHILDVCVDYVGRDGAADMDEIASRFSTQSSVPLVLDSTEPEVLEAGLRWLGGRGDPQLRRTSRTARQRDRGWTACSASPRSTGQQ